MQERCNSSANAMEVFRVLTHRDFFLSCVNPISKNEVAGTFRSSQRCVSGLVKVRLFHLLAVSNVDMFMAISRPLDWSPRTLHASFHTAWDYFTAHISARSWPSSNHITVYWGVLVLLAIYWISHRFLWGIIITKESMSWECPQKASTCRFHKRLTSKLNW